MTPMLARTYGPKFSRFPCYVQPKLNGVRALYQNGTWQSRDGKLWKRGVLAHLTDELNSITDVLSGRMLDGELYVHGWKLQRINGAIAVNRNESNEDTVKVEYHVFDSPSHEKFSKRWFPLFDALSKQASRLIKVVSTHTCADAKEMDSYFHYYTEVGYEGIMLRPDGPYELGETPHGTTKRSEFLWKRKQWEDSEFTCIGITQGEGKADIGIGALICQQYEDNGEIVTSPEFRVGTGFSDEERIEYMKNPPIGKLIKVRYLCLSEDGIPLNPSFLCVMS